MTEQPTATSPLPRLPMTQALTDLLGEVTGWPWEIREIPKVPDPKGTGPIGDRELVPVPPPYGILYPLWRTYSGPAWFNPEADAGWVYQATWVVERGDQLEWADDKTREVIVGRHGRDYLHDLDIPGVSVMGREILPDGSNDETPTSGTIIQGTLRFVLYVTPGA